MRDDLHRTVAVAPAWRTVLRYAPNKADRLSRLPNALEEAVRSSLRRSLTQPFVQSLRDSLSRRDLFSETNAVRHAFEQCAKGIVTAGDREVYDCVRAGMSFNRNADSLLVSSMHEYAQRCAQRNLEHLVAETRLVHAPSAAELRAVLDHASASCDFAGLIDWQGNIGPRPGKAHGELNLEEPVES